MTFIASCPWSIIAAMAGACSSGRKSAIQTKRVAPSPSANTCALALWWLSRPPTTDQATRRALGVDVDDQLARDHAVGEGDDARARLEPAVGDEAGRQARVQRADVGERVPDFGRWPRDDDFTMDRRHSLFSRLLVEEPSVAGRQPGRSLFSDTFNRGRRDRRLAACPTPATSPKTSMEQGRNITSMYPRILGHWLRRNLSHACSRMTSSAFCRCGAQERRDAASRTHSSTP